MSACERATFAVPGIKIRFKKCFLLFCFNNFMKVRFHQHCSLGNTSSYEKTKCPRVMAIRVVLCARTPTPSSLEKTRFKIAPSVSMREICNLTKMHVSDVHSPNESTLIISLANKR